MFPPSLPTEGLYWLCHQRQAPDTLHAREQTVLPVQDVEVCGVAAVWVRHHDFNRSQHRRADDEGWFIFSETLKSLLHQKIISAQLVPFQFSQRTCEMVQTQSYSSDSLIYHLMCVSAAWMCSSRGWEQRSALWETVHLEFIWFLTPISIDATVKKWTENVLVWNRDHLNWIELRWMTRLT